jgi:hypothetical protein
MMAAAARASFCFPRSCVYSRSRSLGSLRIHSMVEHRTGRYSGDGAGFSASVWTPTYRRLTRAGALARTHAYQAGRILRRRQGVRPATAQGDEGGRPIAAASSPSYEAALPETPHVQRVSHVLRRETWPGAHGLDPTLLSAPAPSHQLRHRALSLADAPPTPRLRASGRLDPVVPRVRAPVGRPWARRSHPLRRGLNRELRRRAHSLAVTQVSLPAR